MVFVLKQGVWMGLMTGSGCLSRVLGPVFITYIYAEYGTILTFGLTLVMMAATMLWMLYFSKRLIPQEIVNNQDVEGQELKDVSGYETVPLDETEVIKA